MSSSTVNNPESSLELLETLKIQLRQAPPLKQIPLLMQLLQIGTLGHQAVMDFLLAAKAEPAPTISVGRTLQLLHQIEDQNVQAFLAEHFPTGCITLPSECQINYTEIQTALVQQKFELADRLTLQKMCELAGSAAAQRKWLYFTEVNGFPTVDLQTIDQLWFIYSEGRFGFSAQRKIWLSMGKDWEKLWPKIAWKEGNLWTRYPNGFIWNLEAPVGHLPLTNQLRGVRVMDALMNHSAWDSLTSSA